MACDPRPVILHVIDSLEGGGTERMLISLLRAFDASCLQHMVVTLRHPGSLAAQLPDHVACRPLAVEGRSRTAGFRLASIARMRRASVIHARNSGCWMDAIVAHRLMPIRRPRLILGFHGLDHAGPMTAKHRRLARLGLLTGARFAVVGQSGRRQLQTQAAAPDQRIDLLRNGVDLKRFTPSGTAARTASRRDCHIDDDAFVIGCVGSLTPVKDQAVLIEAAARVARTIPKINLLLVGEGPLRAALENQTNESGLADRVRFTGRREDVVPLLACMDVYVCSSASECMNNALLEAMACGLPVVASDVGDNAFVVRNGVEGRIVPPGSPQAMADAFIELARSSDLRRNMAAAALIRAQTFDFNQAVLAYERYYRSLTQACKQNRIISSPHYKPSSLSAT